jgi:hypothetical protein
MKTSDFETNFTAWLDGKLNPAETAAFEQEMRARGFDPGAERTAQASVRTLLREHSSAPALSNAEFFQHQFLHQLERDEAQPVATATAGEGWWRFPRLIWASAFCLLIAAVLFKALIPIGGSPAERSPYFATVVDARTYEASISVDTVYSPQDNVTVLWLDGLDYLAGDIVAQ